MFAATSSKKTNRTRPFVGGMNFEKYLKRHQ
jgi:hypothetical protein